MTRLLQFWIKTLDILVEIDCHGTGADINRHDLAEWGVAELQRWLFVKHASQFTERETFRRKEIQRQHN
ncbi:hypothetical protein BH10CYA1_BH10CYA1_53830 [soil metagenome]